MKSQFLNFGDDVHDQSVRERIMATVQRIHPRLLILAFLSRVWSPILNYATYPQLRENERQSWQSWIGRFPCAKCRKQLGTCFSWKIQWRYQLKSTFHSETSERSLCVRRRFHTCACSGSRIRGAAAPSTRQVLDKQSRALEIRRSKVSEQTRSRTGERTSECVSELVSLAHTCLGTSSDQGSGERRCQET